MLNHFRVVRRLDRRGRLVRVAGYDSYVHSCSHQVPWFPSPYQIRRGGSRHCCSASHFLSPERKTVPAIIRFKADEPGQIARFVLRILFCLSLLAIGLDAVAPGQQTINRHP